MKIVLTCDCLSIKNEETDYILKLINGFKGNNKIETFLISGGIDSNLSEQLIIDPVINTNFLYSNRNIRSFFKALTFLRRFCKENQIDIIHSNSSYTANIGFNASYTVNVKTVQTIFRISATAGNLKKLRADKYIAVNHKIYEQLVSKNITVIDNVNIIGLNDNNLISKHIELYYTIRQ